MVLELRGKEKSVRMDFVFRQGEELASYPTGEKGENSSPIFLKIGFLNNFKTSWEKKVGLRAQ